MNNNTGNNNNKRARISTKKDGDILSVCEDSMQNVLQFLGLCHSFPLVCKTFSALFNNAPYHKSPCGTVFVNGVWAAGMMSMNEDDSESLFDQMDERHTWAQDMEGSKRFRTMEYIANRVLEMGVCIAPLVKKLPMTLGEYENVVENRIFLMAFNSTLELLEREVTEIFDDWSHVMKSTERNTLKSLGSSMLRRARIKTYYTEVSLGNPLRHNRELHFHISDCKASNICHILSNLSEHPDANNTMNRERKQIRSLFLAIYRKRLYDSKGSVWNITDREFKEKLFRGIIQNDSSIPEKRQKVSSAVVSEMARCTLKSIYESICDTPIVVLSYWAVNFRSDVSPEHSKMAVRILLSVYSSEYLSEYFTRCPLALKGILDNFPEHLVDELLSRFDKTVRPTLHTSWGGLMEVGNPQHVPSYLWDKNQVLSKPSYQKLATFYVNE